MTYNDLRYGRVRRDKAKDRDNRLSYQKSFPKSNFCEKKGKYTLAL